MKEIKRSKIMLELVKKEELNGIWVGDMKDGDVGVIVGSNPSIFSEDYRRTGNIVQRYKNDLIGIGMPSYSGWHEAPKTPCYALPQDCRIRLLKTGEMLVVA